MSRGKKEVISKNIEKLEEEYALLVTDEYTHNNFTVSNDEEILCLSQKREGKRKQKIYLQYSQIENLFECIRLIEEAGNKFKAIKREIKELKKGK